MPLIFKTWLLLVCVTIFTRLLPTLFAKQIQEVRLIQTISKYLPILVLSLLVLHLIFPYFQLSWLQGSLALISITVSIAAAYYKLPLIISIALGVLAFFSFTTLI